MNIEILRIFTIHVALGEHVERDRRRTEVGKEVGDLPVSGQLLPAELVGRGSKDGEAGRRVGLM